MIKINVERNESNSNNYNIIFTINLISLFISKDDVREKLSNRLFSQAIYCINIPLMSLINIISYEYLNE